MLQVVYKSIQDFQEIEGDSTNKIYRVGHFDYRNKNFIFSDKIKYFGGAKMYEELQIPLQIQKVE